MTQLIDENVGIVAVSIFDAVILGNFREINIALWFNIISIPLWTM